MKLAERFHRARFEWEVRALRDTPPLQRGCDEFIALSMVQHRDVLPYLLALKSFARFLTPSRVVLVADPTLTVEDRNLLRMHVPHIEIREAVKFQRKGVPKGGTWERLCAIAEHSNDNYVVQIDADTVALGDLMAVRKAMNDQVSFTLGTEDVQHIQSCAEVSAWAQGRLDGKDHVQLLAECALSEFDPEGRFRYARGCSGFAGFAKGSINPDLVARVSSRMSELLGTQWSAWGTEQFTSNLLVSSSPGGRLLPHPTYCAPTRLKPETVFLHFIGYARFRTALYAQLARRISQELKASVLPQRHAA